MKKQLETNMPRLLFASVCSLFFLSLLFVFVLRAYCRYNIPTVWYFTAMLPPHLTSLTFFNFRLVAVIVLIMPSSNLLAAALLLSSSSVFAFHASTLVLSPIAKTQLNLSPAAEDMKDMNIGTNNNLSRRNVLAQSIAAAAATTMFPLVSNADTSSPVKLESYVDEDYGSSFQFQVHSQAQSRN